MIDYEENIVVDGGFINLDLLKSKEQLKLWVSRALRKLIINLAVDLSTIIEKE